MAEQMKSALLTVKPITIGSEEEISNIKNNPLMQIKTFATAMARCIKLRALKNTFGDDVAGYAEVVVITK